jgi:NADH-quinone oxidoreductase subunit N
MKRLLAYSTIAHAGYMMMPIAAAVALGESHPEGGRFAIAALAFYIGVYLFMNLGAFAIVSFLRNALASEQIDDYAGLIRRSPGLTVCLAVILFSLVGLPPLAGFAAKFTIFAALADAQMFLLLAIGVLNTVLSLFYYLRVVRVTSMAPQTDDRPPARIPLWSIPGMYCAAVTVPILVLGVWWNGLFGWALVAARLLFGT